MLEFQVKFRINGVPFYSFWMQIQNKALKLLKKPKCFSAILCYSAIFCYAMFFQWTKAAICFTLLQMLCCFWKALS